MKRLLILIAACSLAATAADITGTWKGTAETPNGTVERTFVFKVDGTKLTGDTSSERTGKSPIQDGKIDGDNVSFTITVKFEDNEVHLNYKGKVTGDEIKFNVDSPNGFSLEYKAKKVSG